MTDAATYPRLLVRASNIGARACAGSRPGRHGGGCGRMCAHRQRRGVEVRVQDDDTDTVRWTKHQLSIPLTWVCHGEARLRNNAVLQTMACQGDDGGQTVVTSLTDRRSVSVWELSGR